jgi:hypothetical protein
MSEREIQNLLEDIDDAKKKSSVIQNGCLMMILSGMKKL